MGYLEERIYKGLGLDPSANKVTINVEGRHGLAQSVEMPIFSADDKDNIKILVWTLDRFLITFPHPKADEHHYTSYNEKEQTYYLVRTNPKAVAEGMPRYIMPKKAGIYPFLPPRLVEKWERREHIKTLVLTEGFIKAFKASMHGWDIVGLSSITHYSDTRTKTIHKDVARIIQDCGVQNVVMLYDGDCLDISTKDLEAKEDLARRPNTFLNSMLRIRELLTDFEVNIYFAHLQSDQIDPTHPKGLDDLLCDMPEHHEEILQDLLRLSTPGRYFYRLNVSLFAKKLQSYFNLKNAEQFYSAWGELIGEREFVFFGSSYQVDAEGKLERTVPKELKNFIRVGDDYYENIKVPNVATNELVEKLVPRKKGTIADDFGNKAFKSIPKFKAFINLPSNTNYQRIIANCYNLYNPFAFEPEAGDWSTIEAFLRHIFEEQFELGLDYLQIIYQHPTQALPILCLVSKERKTGKTTFVDFLSDIFGDNAIKLGNAELQTNFNSFFATKLIVAVDETSLADNQKMTERLKMLSTTKRIISEGKGKDQTEVDHFAKYILCSNFETNFIYTQEEETRFWVRKVKHIDSEDPTLLQRMHEEIPAFLYFLNSRKISAPHKTRTWFEEDLLKTDALRKLKQEQRPRAVKLTEEYIKELMVDFKMKEVLINAQQLAERVPGLRKYESYLKNIITNEMKADITRTADGTAAPARYKLPRHQVTLDPLQPDIIWDKFFSRAFVFRAADYLTPEEMKTFATEEATAQDIDSTPF